MARCTQQDLVYRAEAEVPAGRAFRSVGEIQAWVDDLRDTWWWQAWYPQVVRVEVVRRDGRRRESVGAWHPDRGAGLVELLHAHWNDRDVLHELAHVLAAARHRSSSHDPAFCRTLYELVHLAVSPGHAVRLRAAYVRHGVDLDWEDELRDRFGPRPMPAGETS